MKSQTKASQFRRNAYYCQMLATDAASAADQSCLMIMRQAWLALAENEDWLNGSPGRATETQGAMAHGS
jgi:hypothetical protein